MLHRKRVEARLALMQEGPYVLRLAGLVEGKTTLAVEAQATQDQIVRKICRQQEVDVSVNRCGDFCSTYPTGFVVNASKKIFDKERRAD